MIDRLIFRLHLPPSLLDQSLVCGFRRLSVRDKLFLRRLHALHGKYDCFEHIADVGPSYWR
jgi:hypothetical protein